jgi:hypothetical protein
MLAAKVLDEHERIMRKLDHRRGWYASSSRAASSRPGSVSGDPSGGTTMAVARSSTLLLTRIAWWNGGRRGVRKTRVRRPSGPVACQSRRSAGPLRRGYAQRADPDAAAPGAYRARSRGSRPSRPAAAATLPARSLLPSSTGRGRASGRPFSFRPRVEGTLQPPRVRLSLFILLCAPGAGRGFRRLSHKRSGAGSSQGLSADPLGAGRLATCWRASPSSGASTTIRCTL